MIFVLLFYCLTFSYNRINAASLPVNQVKPLLIFFSFHNNKKKKINEINEGLRYGIVT